MAKDDEKQHAASCVGLLKQEIRWCENHRGRRTPDYEGGFIKGLHQAIFLIMHAPRGINVVGASKGGRGGIAAPGGPDNGETRTLLKLIK